jgi:hypothetical protein
MLCPLCTSRLVAGEPRRYETLEDHVCCPNDTDYPMRGTVVCVNQKCSACWGKIFWADDGEGPYHTHFAELPWIDGNPCPFDSWHRGSYFQLSYHDEDKTWRIGKLAIKREVHYRSDDHGNKTGKQTCYRIIWDNIYYTNGLVMLHFGIKHFYRQRKMLGEDRAVEEIKRIKQSATWPRAEWWRKAERLYFRVFHPSLYRKAA